MNQLVLAVAAFVGTHFLLSHPLRAALLGRLGEKGFSGLYSVIALATFYWVYVAFRAAPVGDYFWMPGELVWGVASVLMLVASILFAGSFVGNPALPSPTAKADAAKPVHGVFHLTRHPMMWSFALWAIAHALVAPYAASLVLTGGMFVLALGGSAGQDAKKAKLMGDAWTDWATRTSFVPFARHLTGKAKFATLWPGLTPVLGGIVIWLGATYVHPLLGAPVVGLWRVMG
jgi:uncharacterized membrane protein